MRSGCPNYLPRRTASISWPSRRMYVCMSNYYPFQGTGSHGEALRGPLNPHAVRCVLHCLYEKKWCLLHCGGSAPIAFILVYVTRERRLRVWMSDAKHTQTKHHAKVDLDAMRSTAITVFTSMHRELKKLNSALTAAGLEVDDAFDPLNDFWIFTNEEQPGGAGFIVPTRLIQPWARYLCAAAALRHGLGPAPPPQPTPAPALHATAARVQRSHSQSSRTKQAPPRGLTNKPRHFEVYSRRTNNVMEVIELRRSTRMNTIATKHATSTTRHNSCRCSELTDGLLTRSSTLHENRTRMRICSHRKSPTHHSASPNWYLPHNVPTRWWNIQHRYSKSMTSHGTSRSKTRNLEESSDSKLRRLRNARFSLVCERSSSPTSFVANDAAISRSFDDASISEAPIGGNIRGVDVAPHTNFDVTANNLFLTQRTPQTLAVPKCTGDSCYDCATK